MSAAVSEAARAQALALAAMLECATLVDELARTGEARAHGVRTLANGLLRFEWQRVEDVWGGGGALGGALQRLESALMLSAGDAQAPALRYALALAHLGKRLARDRERLALIRGRLQALAADAQQFTQDFDTVAPALAALYEETISRYSFRIKVTGSPGHLRDPRVVARIRALLLAGVRAAVLWRFVGGNLPGLLLGRARLIAACRALRAGH
ncbi:MAG: High frequency lysogenization protein HflD [Pseudomonadales bacterium]|nr:High frequency lysogenization protein HflD [Pseudomonadales bacterium]